MSQILSKHKKTRSKNYDCPKQQAINEANKKGEIKPQKQATDINWPYDEAWDCQDVISSDESYEPSDEEIAACENLGDLNDSWEVHEEEIEVEDLPINYLNNEPDEW